MNGSYSKINELSSRRSKSVDITDLSHSKKPEDFRSKSCRGQEQIKKQSTITEEMSNEVDKGTSVNHEVDVGEIFGVILNRQRSASATISQRTLAEKQSMSSSSCSSSSSSSLQGILKKAISLKRSSSTPQGYCRIHHQSEAAAAADNDEYNNRNPSSTGKTRQMKSKKKGDGRKILNVCKRLFGF